MPTASPSSRPPAAADVVAARDAAILAALRESPRTQEALLEMMPVEPGQDVAQRRADLLNATARLRLRGVIVYDVLTRTWRKR